MEKREELEFLPKKRSKEAKKLLFSSILKSCRKDLRKNHGLTFEPFLIGSARFNLILVPINKNNKSKRRLFDLDVQIIIHKYHKKNLVISDTKNIIKAVEKFMTALNKAMKIYGFQPNNGDKVQHWNATDNAYNFSFDIVLLIKDKTQNDEQNTYRIVKNKDNKIILNQEPLYNPHSILKTLKFPGVKREVKDVYKILREQDYSIKDRDNYELLIEAIQIVNGPNWEKAMGLRPKNENKKITV